MSNQKQLQQLTKLYQESFTDLLRGLISVEFVPLTVTKHTVDFLHCSMSEYLRHSWWGCGAAPGIDLDYRPLNDRFYSELATNKNPQTVSWSRWWLVNNKLGVPLNLTFSPLINHESGDLLCYEVIAKPLRFNSQQVMKNVFLNDDILLPESSSRYFLGLNFNPLKLASREHEILFLFCCGLIDKEISYVLSRILNKAPSSSTIRNTINGALFSKFSVVNRQQLKSRAEKYYYHIQIPELLIRSSNLVVHSNQTTQLNYPHLFSADF